MLAYGSSIGNSGEWGDSNSPSSCSSLNCISTSCQVHSLCSSHTRRSIWNKSACSKSREMFSSILRTHHSPSLLHSAYSQSLNTVSSQHIVNRALCTWRMMWSRNRPQHSSCVEPELGFTAVSSDRAGHVLGMLSSQSLSWSRQHLLSFLFFPDTLQHSCASQEKPKSLYVEPFL